MGTAFLQGIHTYVAEIITYTWDRYNLLITYTESTSPYYNAQEPYNTYYYGTGYSFNSSTGIYTVTGIGQRIDSSVFLPIAVKKYLTKVASGASNMWYANAVNDNGSVFIVEGTQYGSYQVSSKGSNAGTTTSENINAYPANGEKNGYWYVRRA